MINNGTSVIRSRSRQPRMATGFGPLSTTIALLSPVRIAIPSP